jgi:hypothetical protein
VYTTYCIGQTIKGLRMQLPYELTSQDLAIFGLSQVLIIGAVVQLREKFKLLKGMSSEQLWLTLIRAAIKKCIEWRL